jgi:hypothetical protein
MTDLIEDVADAAQSLAGRLAGVSVVLLAAALAIHVARIVARSRAWHNIAQAAYPGERLHFRHSLGAYLCGTGTNAVLPARSGEVMKLRVVHRKAQGTRYQGLASTVLTESVFDVVVGSILLVLAFFFGWRVFGHSLPAPVALTAHHPLLAAAAVLALALGGALVWRRLRRVVAGGACGFAILRQPHRYLTTVVSWQLVGLGLRLASIACFLAAFHLPASPQTALLVLGVQTAADLIPLTPNGAGTQQALLAAALGATALGFGAGMQLATASVEVLLGLVSLALLTGSLSLRALVGAEPAVAASTT